MKTEEEKINQGYRVYDRFVNRLLPKGVELTTPRTNTALLFALLQDANEDGLLMREMMQEVISSLPDDEVRVRNGVLYRIQEKYVEL